MKIAVTGAFGYSGRYMATRLLAAGHEVITLTNSVKRQNPFHLLPNAIVRVKPHALNASCLMTTQRKSQFEQEEFFENESVVIGRISMIQFFEIVTVIRKVNPMQSGFQIGKSVRLANILR